MQIRKRILTKKVPSDMCQGALETEKRLNRKFMEAEPYKL
jgi:hypothetical protein